MQIKFSIQNMPSDHASFLVEKFAPAFGIEVVTSATPMFSKTQITFTVSGTPGNAQAFERHIKSEVAAVNGTYTEK